MKTNTIFQGDVIEKLKQMPDESVDCVITSPPYWGLRDYGAKGQIGLEKTPELFVEKMVEVFRGVRRVLKKEGTLWLNIGDSYCGTASKGEFRDPKYKDGRNGQGVSLNAKIKGVKSKDLVGIPWMLAFALRADGWYLRQDIIWNKPNPMPESVTDRCTKAHEYIFLLTKSPKYFYDHEAIKQPAKETSIERMDRGVSDHHKNIDGAPGQRPHSLSTPRENKKYKGSHPAGWANSKTYHDQDPRYKKRKEFLPSEGGSGSGLHERDNTMANKRSVWTVSTRPFKDAHFATFPEQLIEPMILAGCPEGGVCLDPFMGAGTTAIVALKLQRKYLGIEINPAYIEIANKRLGGITIPLPM